MVGNAIRYAAGDIESYVVRHLVGYLAGYIAD
jgi:hypothetical protein